MALCDIVSQKVFIATSILLFDYIESSSSGNPYNKQRIYLNYLAKRN